MTKSSAEPPPARTTLDSALSGSERLGRGLARDMVEQLRVRSKQRAHLVPRIAERSAASGKEARRLLRAVEENVAHPSQVLARCEWGNSKESHLGLACWEYAEVQFGGVRSLETTEPSFLFIAQQYTVRRNVRMQTVQLLGLWHHALARLIQFTGIRDLDPLLEEIRPAALCGLALRSIHRQFPAGGQLLLPTRQGAFLMDTEEATWHAKTWIRASDMTPDQVEILRPCSAALEARPEVALRNALSNPFCIARFSSSEVYSSALPRTFRESLK